MNLLEGLSDLQGGALTKVLRRTIVTALIVGAVAVLLIAFLGSLWGALGLIIGLGLAIVNLRFLDAGVAKLKPEGEMSVSNKVLRRTILSALIVGAVAVVLIAFLGSLWGALGLIIGLGLAIVNLRFLDSGIAKLTPEGDISVSNKVLRRAMGTKSVTRLGIITVICIGLLLINGALGIGAVAGLVIFQLLFVVNVGRIVMSQGIQ